MSDIEEVLKIARIHFHRYIDNVKNSQDLNEKKKALCCAEAIYELERDLIRIKNKESDKIWFELSQILKED